MTSTSTGRTERGTSSLIGFSEPRRFRPRLSLGYGQDLVALVKDMVGRDLAGRISCVRRTIDTAEARSVQLHQLGRREDELAPTVFYLATLRLLRDLVLQGWMPDVDDDGIFILPPSFRVEGDDPSDAKSDLRDSFRFAVTDQLQSPSVSSFVTRMERQGVATLLADGPELAKRIEAALANDDASGGIHPVLELVEPDSRDSSTGLRLQDIWRYARLQWSIPYKQTPGRNLHYLVRDSAGNNRPIIGIAALGSAILGLAQRDRALGWSSSALADKLDSASDADQERIARHLLTFMLAEIERIHVADLDLDGLNSGEAIARLQEIEREADARRHEDQRRAGDERTAEYLLIREAHSLVEDGRADEADWVGIAQTHLYRRKRSAHLADTLRTLDTFCEAGVDQEPARLRDLFRTEPGCRAVENVLRRIKQQAIAENVMEIITCGAIPPYQVVLGGKLVAMLMASPQVVGDVKRRYEGKVSLIASGMAGRPICRTPALAVLTTSSLYAFGSAQYNRVRVPGHLVGGSGEIRYERVGTTDGFGTVQFASDTTQSLTAVARLANDKRRIVNNLFGEGMSPKLRSLRMGVSALGLDPDQFLRHHSPRLLYAVPLVRNADDLLFGLTRTPEYVLPPEGGAKTTQAIAEHWAARWLSGRIAKPKTLGTLHATRRSDHLVSGTTSDLGQSSQSESRSSHPDAFSDLRCSSSDGPISFIERLYRNTHSYADRLTREELDWISVDMGLDNYLIDSAEAGWQIVVTGNPGDGKTFLIERLRQTLVGKCGAVVVTDANACTDAEILASWRSCDENGRAFILAINEWPLFDLRRLARTEAFAPVEEAVRQVRNATFYGDPPEGCRGKVAVVDLNLRNVLAPRVVTAAIDRLTADRFAQGLSDADPAGANLLRLRSPRVQERLAALMDQASRRGEHVTMRQLLGFLAYVMTGGTDAPGRMMSQGSGRYLYANAAFEGGEGPLFDLVRRSFDPAKVTHPDLDEDLWRGTTDPADWLEPSDMPMDPASCPIEERELCFKIAKRRFFFEHSRGGDLLDLLPADEADFDRVLREGLDGDPELVRELILAVNRFYEPDCPKDEDSRLTLWQSHRYDVRAPAAFVALYSQPASAMTVEGPQFAEWVHAWLPDDLRHVTRFCLSATGEGDRRSRLIIDREVYLTLQEAAAGLGRSMWSRSVARKVTRFADEQHRMFHEPKPLSDLEIRNFDTDLRARLQVRRNPPRYEL